MQYSNPFVDLHERLLNVEGLLLQINDVLRTTSPAASQLPTQSNKYLTATDAAKFLGIAKQTLYQNIERVPHTKRFGKLYFLESDLTAYLEGGQVR